MSKLLDYLNHLDQNVPARAAHNQNPQKAMTDFGLSQPEQAAVTSGDKAQVAHVVGISSESLPPIEVSQF
jgi:hypothetical protein